jgi:DNA-binding CsgD family transcriptional regulator
VSSVSSEQALVDAAILAFRRGALEDGPWIGALRATATACGANHGAMIGIGPAAAIPFNWVSDCPPEALDEFQAVGGGDPRVNPRVRAGLGAPELKILAESDFATPDVLRATPIYADLFTRYDMPFVALTRLTTTHDVTIGLSVLRSARQGHVGEHERTVLAAIAPHARSAVSLRLSLEHRGGSLVGGALEAVAAAAFVLDFGGRVAAMTPAAEALVSGPDARLKLAGRRLQGRNPQDETTLSAFLLQAVEADDAATPALIALRGEGRPLVLEAMAAPQIAFGLGFAPKVIIVARSGDEPVGAAPAARAAFNLTVAEVAVATALRRGLSPDEIAVERRVSIETVRSQIRALMTKTETRRQSELVALLSRYL